MVKVVSIQTMRQIEVAADAAGMSYDTMMQNAGTAAATRLHQVIAERFDPEQTRVSFLIGPGNNGGDGLVAARVLAQNSKAQVRCYLLKRRDESDVHYKAAIDAGIFMANAEDDQRFRVLTNMIASAQVVVDALFGIGVKLPLRPDVEKFLRSVQQALQEGEGVEPDPRQLMMPASPAPIAPSAERFIFAIDCPSGLDCDSGELDKQAIKADETITFIAAKPGLFLFPGAEAVGELTIAPLGIPEDLEPLKAVTDHVADANFVRRLLPSHSSGAHKGTFGKALIVAGSVNYTGAPALSAEAAYRIGAGLVTVGAPQPVVSIVASHITEATWLLLSHDMGVIAASAAAQIRRQATNYTALLIGPGMGREKTTGEMLQRLLDANLGPRSAEKRAIGFGVTSPSAGEDQPDEGRKLPPLVIDADGLNLLSTFDQWWTLLPESTVLTPHPGEMATLAGIEIKDVQADRWGIALRKSAEWNVILVLKGADTLIAAPDGRAYVLPFKTAALATAGTGDVLAGIIVGLLAQGLDAFDAAVVGGYIHGLAGQIIGEQVGTRGATAGDVVHYGLPQALQRIEGN